jgi:aminopeptidase N
VAEKSNLTLEEARGRAAVVAEVTYRIVLDLTDQESFVSDATISFSSPQPGADTFLDITAKEIVSAAINGRAIPADAFDGNRLTLTGLADRNEVHVVARCAYHRTEMGMHRFVDPVDGRVYLHTDFEPYDAHLVFASFDQPDLKGTFEWEVVAPQGWEVVANSRPVGEPATEREGVARWRFERTPPIPTYISCVCAGQWHAVRSSHRGIDLGLLCRASLAEHLEADELLEVTRQGLDFFEDAFAYPYPFGKYDQVFVPESNSGAMENAGCVTFNDLYIFRSRVTDAARERRAETVLHEMAHMWFGDLVTMRWWNDLWLNESFASYMAVLAEEEATRWTEAWTTFADTEKTWAYRQDQLPTTHPIVADIPDLESIHLNFDGITYAKGASVLKQLAAWVGQGKFLDGVKAYCKRHEFGNAELADFLAALEESSGRDLAAWSGEWLESAGVNTLRPSFELDEGGAITSFAVLQEAPERWPTLRRHRLAVGLYDLQEGSLRLRRRVELDVRGGRTDVDEVAGERAADLVLLNDRDLTYGKIRLDPASLQTVVEKLGTLEDSLARALCWTASWDMMRDGEMAARDYLRLVLGNIASETKVSVVQSLLAQAAAAVYVYGSPQNRQAAGETLAEAALGGATTAAAGSDHQLAWVRSFIGAARSPEHLTTVRGLLDGEVPFEGLTVDTELRWHIVRSLAAAGRADEDLIAAEERRDPTDRGSRHGAAARAARPTAEAKDEAWRLVVENGQQPLALTEEVMLGFQQFDQEEVLAPYAEAFCDVLREVWQSRDVPDALAFARRLYPHVIVATETIDRTERYLDGDAVPAPLRRLLVEGKDGLARVLRTRAADV